MPRAIFFIKIAGRLMSIHLRLCFPLSLLLFPSVLAFASFYFHPVLPSVLAPASFYSHPVLLSILPLFPSVLAFASIYSCLWFSLSLPRFLLFPPLLPSIIAPSQICFSTPQIHQSPFFFPRLFPAATHPFRHETVYREQFSCHLAMFPAATHLFPHISLYREQSDMSSPDFQFAIQVFSTKRVCRRQKTHPLNQNATAAHENLLLRVCRG